MAAWRHWVFLKGSVMVAILNRYEAARSWLSKNWPILLQLGIIIFGFRGYAHLIYNYTQLNGGVYEQKFVFLSSLTSLSFVVFLVLPQILLLANWSKLKWSEFDHSKWLRIFIFFCALPLAWYYSTFEFNYFLGHSHLFDRIFLIILLGLIWVHPAFASIFIVFLMAFANQFYQPFGHLSGSDRKAPIDMLILFGSLLYFKLFSAPWAQGLLKSFKPSILKIDKRRSILLFLILAAGIIGGLYATPAIVKVFYSWLQYEQLDLILPSKYLRGWLATLDPGVIASINSYIQLFNKPMIIGVLILEFAGMWILFKRRLFVLLLVAFCLLHIMIFVLAGILFWKWIFVDIALAVCVWQMTKSEEKWLFNRANAWIVFFLVLFSIPLFNAQRLGWLDINFDRLYELEVKTESGRTLPVHWSTVHPYSLTFGSNRFDYLLDEPTINRASSWDIEFVKEVLAVRDPSEVKLIKEKYASLRFDESKKKNFELFLRRYFSKIQDPSARLPQIFYWIQAPNHIHSFISDIDFKELDKIVSVSVRVKEYIGIDHKFHKVLDKELMEITLQDQPKN